MNSLLDMIWIEWRKVIRSGMLLWTALGSLFMPFGIAFLIFVARNPEISRRLGLISAKADLLAYSATDWPAYLKLFGQLMAMGGFFLFSMVITWMFGREFADGTLKDWLAVPVQRSIILLAKLIVFVLWSALLTMVIFVVGLITGMLIGLPGGSIETLIQGSAMILVTAFLTIVIVIPLALLASVGRGYLLSIGAMVLLVMAANVLALAGWGAYFPWGIPGLYATDKSVLTAASYGVVLFTGLAGMVATHFWWKFADQSR